MYQALDLRYELTSGPKSSSEHVRTGTFAGTMSSIWRTVKSGGLQGDYKQQGGSFVINTDGAVEFCHRDGGTMDHMPINDLLAKVGVAPVVFAAASAKGT